MVFYYHKVMVLADKSGVGAICILINVVFATFC